MVELNCKVLSMGEGYRSENHSISVLTRRPYYLHEASGIVATVYPVSYNVFNPTGAYLYMNWKMSINKTHYTVIF